MLRLPWFEYRAPRSVAEAAKILAGEGPRAMLIAGGTDLLPNMKRRHQTPKVLVSLRGISSRAFRAKEFFKWGRGEFRFRFHAD
jgi:4-hydroxybenzoyl-CoA reductase subunit beta